MMRVVLKIVIIFAFTLPCNATQLWTAIEKDSEIKFIASYDGVEFTGYFPHFDSEFNINPTQSTQNKLTSKIDVTSVDTQSRDRDQALADSDWFHFKAYPKATFSSTSVKKLNDTTFDVTGILTIRDIKKEITFPITWQVIERDIKKAQATISLDRRDYDIGIGEWLDDETIGFNVDVIFSINYKLSN